MNVQQLNQLQATEAFGKSFKPMLKDMQNYSSVYICFYALDSKKEKKKKHDSAPNGGRTSLNSHCS
jgi:hypothetical protein